MQDILPYVPSALPLVVVDYLLRSLTHISPFRRRSALALLILSCFFATRILVSVRSALNPPRVAPPSPWDLEDALALNYVPSPPTGAQQAAHTRLVSLIESRRSAYPPSLFRDAALRSEASPAVGVTAVVLHWKRRKGLELVVRHITRYPFIREVIVWNNRPGVDLSSEVRPFPPRRPPPPRALLTPLPSPCRTSSSRARPGLTSRPPSCASSTRRRTCTTPASTSRAAWPRSSTATSTTMTGSTSTWTRPTPSTSSAARAAA